MVTPPEAEIFQKSHYDERFFPFVPFTSLPYEHFTVITAALLFQSPGRHSRLLFHRSIAYSAQI
jgi:hypothetical protein